MENYKSIEKKGSAELNEKHSIFIGNASFIETKEAALLFINDIKRQHKSASHNAFAFIVKTQNQARYSDDREPAKTAGMPILSLLQNLQLTNIAVVVTRYFGGTLLGTGGLVKAYQGAALLAINAAGIVQYKETVEMQITTDYKYYDTITRLISDSAGQVVFADFKGNVVLRASLLKSSSERLQRKIKEHSCNEAKITIIKEFWQK